MITIRRQSIRIIGALTTFNVLKCFETSTFPYRLFMKPPRLQRMLIEDSDISRAVGPSDATLVDAAMGEGTLGNLMMGESQTLRSRFKLQPYRTVNIETPALQVMSCKHTEALMEISHT